MSGNSGLWNLVFLSCGWSCWRRRFLCDFPGLADVGLRRVSEAGMLGTVRFDVSEALLPHENEGSPDRLLWIPRTPSPNLHFPLHQSLIKLHKERDWRTVEAQ